MTRIESKRHYVEAMGASAAAVAHVATVTRPDIEGDVDALAKHGKTEGSPQQKPEATKEEGQAKPKASHTGRVDPTVAQWKDIQQDVEAKSGPNTATTPGQRSTGTGLRQAKPNNPYANTTSVRRDDIA